MFLIFIEENNTILSERQCIFSKHHMNNTHTAFKLCLQTLVPAFSYPPSSPNYDIHTLYP